MARLDTGWHANPKILRLGWAAMGLHAWSISYCDLALSDGFLPEKCWPALPGWRAAVRALVTHNLWEKTEGGYRLHDYMDYNSRRVDVLARREAAQARKERWKERVRNASRNARGTPSGTRGGTASGTPRERRIPVPGGLTMSKPAGLLGGPASQKDPGSTPARARTHEAEGESHFPPELLAEHQRYLDQEHARQARASQPDSKTLNEET
jgi:hypothetical protein